VATRSVGLFGGTFDPPHRGHVEAIHAALRQLDLDEVIVTVAGTPQLKSGPPVASPALRLEMATAAFADIDRVTVSDVEIRRRGPTFTIDTVDELVAADPERSITLLVGADAARGLSSWHRADDLARLVTVAVMPRPGEPIAVPEGFSCVTVDMVPVDLSSTEVRADLRKGVSPEVLVPASVVRILLTHPLYSP
jgi:nicotinate-nucleotide adenylyltransferase